MIALGNWEDHLSDVTCDALVVDPPFGKRVHEFTATRIDRPDEHNVNRINYDHWSPKDVAKFVKSWSPRCRGWIVALTSHDLIPAWEIEYKRAGRYAFAPVPCVIRGMTVRLAGDGPSSWTVYAMVARPKHKKFCGGWTNPGAYVVGRGQDHANAAHLDGSGRGKPAMLMQALVRDYSRPDDLVVDPMCGYGSTGVAALSLGRRFIGCERNPAVHSRAVEALARPQQHDLFPNTAA